MPFKSEQLNAPLSASWNPIPSSHTGVQTASGCWGGNAVSPASASTGGQNTSSCCGFFFFSCISYSLERNEFPEATVTGPQLWTLQGSNLLIIAKKKKKSVSQDNGCNSLFCILVAYLFIYSSLYHLIPYS